MSQMKNRTSQMNAQMYADMRIAQISVSQLQFTKIGRTDSREQERNNF